MVYEKAGQPKLTSRIQFINLAEADLSYSAMQNSRAAFCELLASELKYPGRGTSGLDS